MKLLVLGGTVFRGRAIVDEALEAGHEVTLFNRGRHNPDLYPQVEKLRGDRDGDLGALEGRRFDATIDTCGYVPRIVGASARLLADACGHYTFISSLSVYANNDTAGEDEDAEIARTDDETVEEITGETYGPLKALCEQAVEASFPESALIVRPGLIVGPRDPTDRFTYWVQRIGKGGDVLAPKPADMRVEFTDVRDLGAWIVRAVTGQLTGHFNVSGPSRNKIAFDVFAELCRSVSASDARMVWADEQWLAEHEVQLWSDMPMRVPAASPGFSTRSSERALDAGMVFRGPAETIRDTLGWSRGRKLEAGLTLDREAELLAVLRSI